jgi:hypothetical protein
MVSGLIETDSDAGVQGDSYLYDPGMGQLALPPVGVMVRDVIVNPTGSRAFALLTDNTLHTYDLTIAPSGSPVTYNDSVAAMSFAIPTVTQPTLRALMTPDGATLFIAGDAGVRVLPPPG